MSFLGVPFAPYFFISAKHFGGAVGTVFVGCRMIRIASCTIGP